MSVVQHLYGMAQWINYEAGQGPAAPVHAIDFFINDFTPVKTDLIGAFTFLTKSQWSRTGLDSLGFNILHGQADGSQLYNDGIILSIIDPYAGSPVTVYGWALIDIANNQVVLSERYATSLVLPLTGSVIYAPVSLQVGHYAP